MRRQATVKASEAHRAFGKLLKRVSHSDEHLIVERAGVPVAVLLSYQEYEGLCGQEAVAAFERFARAFGAELERTGTSEAALQAEVAVARQEVYAEQYGQGS